VIENRSCEGTDCQKAALSSAVTSVQVMVASARSVSCGTMNQWPYCISYLVQAVRHIEWKHKIRNILIVTTDHNPHWCSRQSSVLPLMFLKSVCILSGCPVINICSCHQDRKLSWVGPMECHAHAGFHYSKLLAYLCHDYSGFSNISGLDLGGSVYRQVVKLLRY
jgi:hypothetical protein